MFKFIYLFIGLSTIILGIGLPSVNTVTLLPQNPNEFINGPIQSGIAESKCETYIEQACKENWVPEGIPLFGIVGGRPANPKEFPHMALIGASEKPTMKWLCGGSLISEHFVLSAAHCNSTPVGDAKLIRLGELDFAITKDDATPMDFLILEKFVHPKYNPPAMYNDIALFRFEGLKSFTAYIRPTCLNYLDNLPPTVMPSASGWGTISYEGPTSTVLRTVNLELYNVTVCDQRITGDVVPNGLNDTLQICAGLMAGGKDACKGDSGGPLQLKRRNKCAAYVYTQIGVVSFGLGCGELNTPGGYTKVSHYIPWIEKIVWSNLTSNIFSRITLPYRNQPPN